jgi:phosphotransferase system enzyme I (PtsP)
MPPIGVMVEVPSAVFMIEELARRVDFISVGTNDLTQYLLAVDRNNTRVAGLYDDLHPTVLRALEQVVRGARLFNRPVGICGELAGNPMATALLMGLGVDSLSMSAGSLMKVKWVVRSFSVSRARQLLHAALRMEDPAQVRGFVERALDERGLGGLFRPGR